MAPSKKGGAEQVTLNANDESLEKLFIGLVGASIIVVETMLLVFGIMFFVHRPPCGPACKVIFTADRSGEEGGVGVEAQQLACIDAAALVQVVPCEAPQARTWEATSPLDGATIPLADVRVGHCVWDGRGPAEVYYRASAAGPAPVVEVAAASGRVALTPSHLVPLRGGLVPAGRVRRNDTLVTGAVVVEVASAEPRRVEQVYTRSGHIAVGGIVMSCYEHWTDAFTTMDAYILYRVFGSHVVTSSAYVKYFDSESALLDPVVHWLWPTGAPAFLPLLSA